jgi:prophage tail gpP-like protein
MTTAKGFAELKIDGMIYGGWRRVSVTRSIEQLAGRFDLEITERWPGQPEATPIRPGQRCVLTLDGRPVITGWVDGVTFDYDAASHRIRVIGRDLTGDLVDCSAIHKSGQWRNATIQGVARDLLAPYGIRTILQDGVDTGAPFASYNIQEGESVFECLARAARLRALLLTSDPEGRLVITRAGSERLETGLVEGRNIKAARAEILWQERYSTYIAKGQARLGSGGDLDHAASSATVDDANIPRHRPLIVLADTQGDNATQAERVEWERNVRRGRSVRGQVTVQGWTRADGRLWLPNAIVPVTSPLLWLDDAQMLIVGCTYTLDDQAGALTELAIARPDAFDLIEGLRQNKLFGQLKTRADRLKKESVMNWSTL